MGDSFEDAMAREDAENTVLGLDMNDKGYSPVVNMYAAAVELLNTDPSRPEENKERRLIDSISKSFAEFQNAFPEGNEFNNVEVDYYLPKVVGFEKGRDVTEIPKVGGEVRFKGERGQGNIYHSREIRILQREENGSVKGEITIILDGAEQIREVRISDSSEIQRSFSIK